MRELEPDQLIQLAGLLVTLMIFFSIDAKTRFGRTRHTAKRLFHLTSITGGIATAVALVVVWVELFTSGDVWKAAAIAYFLPASLAIVAALVLAFEVIFFRNDDPDDDIDEAI